MPASDFTPADNSAYIFANGPEERAGHLESWPNDLPITLVEVLAQESASITVKINEARAEVKLRSGIQLKDLMSSLPQTVYLDITGLSHQTWAPLLRAAVESDKHLFCVYVEPAEYTRTNTPTEGTIYDLSEKTTGIAPLPGFANLVEHGSSTTVGFVPLLGFEGTRFIHVTEHVQPTGDATVPVVGVPGFRTEYPFAALRGNRKPLVDSGSWVNTRYSTANCPFDLFFTLRAIAEEMGFTHLLVAPIGTKPHGLGAVLFALSAESIVELIYDHPVRKPGRTSGQAHLCLYDIGTFIRSIDFRWHASTGRNA